jgi:hypothetical protein
MPDITLEVLKDRYAIPPQGRFPNPQVGPQSRRFMWRPTPIQDKFIEARVDRETGPIINKVPNHRVGPPVLRRQSRWMPNLIAFRTPVFNTQSLDGTMGGLSGILAGTKIALISLVGTMGSLSGTLVKQTNKLLTGTMGALTGTLVKMAKKVLSGAPASLAGTLIKAIFKPLTGSPDSLVGTLIKRTFKSFAGSINLSGILTTAGVFFRTLTGSLSDLTGSLGIFQVIRRAKMRAGSTVRTAVDGGIRGTYTKINAGSVVRKIFGGGNRRSN